MVGVLVAGTFGTLSAQAEDRSFQSDRLAVVAGGPLASPAVLAAIDEEGLEALRGGDSYVVDSYNTNASSSATANSTNSFGSVDVTGDVIAGNVTIRDGAMAQFRGVVTQAFGTAPGINVSAQTSLSFTLVE